MIYLADNVVYGEYLAQRISAEYPYYYEGALLTEGWLISCIAILGEQQPITVVEDPYVDLEAYITELTEHGK